MPASPAAEALEQYTQFSYEALSAATGGFSDAQLVGEGAFGRVFRCTLPGFGFQAAVKVFEAADDSALAEAFAKEAQELSRHPHPHIVRMFGASADGPRLCLVTEYMAGGSAQARLEADPPLS